MSAAAERAADAGMEQALRNQRKEEWKRRAEGWLDEQPQGRLFTSDDLIESIGKADLEGGRNSVHGAWLNAQARAKRIEDTGRTSRSDRVEGHGNKITLWRVKDEREERVGGDAGKAAPHAAAGVSSSSYRRVLEEASAAATLGPEARVGASSSSPDDSIPDVSAEEQEWEDIQTLPAMGEQLGLLAPVSPLKGAYSREAA